MFSRFALSLFLSYWLTATAVAQQVETVRVKTAKGPYLRFDQFTVNNEAFRQANGKQMVLHDSRGYLWFLGEPDGDGHLIRYDGTYYKSFGTGWSCYHSDLLGMIGENDTNEIWAVNKRGLAEYNSATETFRYWRNPFVKQQGIYHWIMEPGGRHWFVSEEPMKHLVIKPLYSFDSRTRQVRQFIPGRIINGYAGQTETAKPRSFHPYCIDPTGRVWGDVHSSTYNTIGYYDVKRNALVWYPVRGVKGIVAARSSVADFQFDAFNVMVPDGKYVWIGGWDRMGLLRLDTQTGRYKQFYFSNLGHNRVFAMIRRNDHQFWLRTDQNVLLFDTLANTLYTYFHEPDNPFTPGIHAGAATGGRNNTHWLSLSDQSSSSTLSVLYEKKQPFRILDDSLLHFTNGSYVLGRKNHTLYITYNRDKYVCFSAYDEATKKVRVIYRLPLNGLTEQSIHQALPDSLNQTSWLMATSAAGSLFRFDEKRGTVTPVTALIAGLPLGENQTGDYKEIRCAVQDKAGNVWFPSFGARGKYAGNLLKFDCQTKQFVGYRAGTRGLLVAQIRTAMADGEGQIWLGYRATGTIVRFNPSTSQATVILPSVPGMEGMKIVDDPARGVVWVARHAGGLWRYDRRTKTAHRVMNEIVLNVHLTKTGVLWLKTMTALLRYVPETEQITRFGPGYELVSFNWTGFVKTADDEFFFEKFRFRDRDIKPDTAKPAVVLSFLKVFDRDLQLPKSLNYMNEITLNYDQNFFTIGFSVLSYFQQERNQYAYRLVGFNRDWVSVGNKPLAVFSNVPPGTYPFQIRGSTNDGVWSDVKTVSVRVIPPFWQTMWFRGLVAVLVVASIIALYRIQVERRTLKLRLEAEEAKRKQTEAELNEREAAYQLKISQTEMAALRSQMNPHFIFNCLNSIQFFTAQNDADKATDYLAKFSRLIRLVLENSKSDKVTLANELETLQLYIEMETMRFQNKLHYSIKVNEAIDPESIQIPPLLLQPFVENAIWHGLMHKEEGGLVQVVVEQPTEDLLHIEISDDGVGRAKAAEYKSKSATKNKSFGLKMTAERIALINQLYHTQTQVQVIDRTDSQGHATGTTVVVEILV